MGAGTDNYLPKWSSNTLTSTSTVYDDGTNVGIGTNNPSSYKLQVNGSLGATTKSFIINHQRISGSYLIHGSLEGPEHGVYIRGKTETNVIELPDYWEWLINKDTISVQLTSIGKHQKLYIEKIENNKVYINCGLFEKINCYYFIQAERKDVVPLKVII